MNSSGVYLLCLTSPLGNERHQARHYLGYGDDLAVRLAVQLAGGCHASKFCQAARQKGIAITVARLWLGATRSDERWLKNRKEARELCPICSGHRAHARGLKLPSRQLALPLDDGELLELPAAVAGGRMDSYEFLIRRAWRQARAVPAVISSDEGDDLL